MYKTQIFRLPSNLIDVTPDDTVIHDCVIRPFRYRKMRYVILAPEDIQIKYVDRIEGPFDAIGGEIFQSTSKEGKDFIFFDGQRVFIFNKNLLSILRVKD